MSCSVSDITSDAAIMAALGRQMTMAVQRQMVSASNLANLDTPGYKAKAANFQSALESQLDGLALTTTNPAHVSATGPTITLADPEDGDTADTSPRRDGNNVQLDRELLSMGRASADFSAAQTVLAAKFRLVRYAINEGR